VTKLEFLCAALMASERVSEHELSQMLYEFHKLDPLGSGKVTHAQLSVLAGRHTAPEPDEKLFAQARSPVQGPSPYNFEFGGACTQLPAAVADRSLPAYGFVAESEAQVEEDPEHIGLQWLVEDLQHDVLELGQRLDAKEDELIQAMTTSRSKEQLLQQALARQQGLQGELYLQQHVGAEVQARADEGRRSRERVESQVQEFRRKAEELELREQAADRRAMDGEKRRRDAEKQHMVAKTLLNEVQERLQASEQRARAAELSSSDLSRRFADLERTPRPAQLEAALSSARLQRASAELQQQEKLSSAILELHALGQGQDARYLGAAPPQFHVSSALADLPLSRGYGPTYPDNSDAWRHLRSETTPLFRTQNSRPSS